MKKITSVRLIDFEYEAVETKKGIIIFKKVYK
jgi:hypothetical protein